MAMEAIVDLEPAPVRCSLRAFESAGPTPLAQCAKRGAGHTALGRLSCAVDDALPTQAVTSSNSHSNCAAAPIGEVCV